MKRLARWALLIVAGGLVTLAVSVIAFKKYNDASVVKLAAALLDCAEEVELLSSVTTDTAEVYEVRGCGFEATLFCAAPDFECSIINRTKK